MLKDINVQTIAITELRDDFFAIMEEICIEDMDDEALREYQQRHEDDETGAE